MTETGKLEKRAPIEYLLRPRSVAIVGASATKGSFGASVLENLEAAGYGGGVYLVNPKRDRIGERPCLPSIDALPDGVDCAVLAIPRAGVLDSVQACIRRGVGSVIIFAAGFAEAGEAGRREQQELGRLAEEHGIAIQGPNCLGLTNYLDGVSLTFVSTPPQGPFTGKGVAIISQSGAIAAVLGTSLRHHGLSLSYSVSTGNEAAYGVEKFLEFMVDDPRTSVIAMVAEQFRKPQEFLAVARRAQDAGKRIVLLHPGSSQEGRASGATHTGAMAGDYKVMRLNVEDAGVVVVDTIEELVDSADILFRCASIPRGGAAVFAESGAFKAFTLDFCEAIGLPLPPLSDEKYRQLRGLLPDFIMPTNPLDITAQGLVDPDIYRRCIPPILQDPLYGSLVLAIILTDAQTSALKFEPILGALREIEMNKPVVFAGLDEGASVNPEYVRQLRGLGVPFFASTERAYRALNQVRRRAERLERVRRRDVTAVVSADLPVGVVPEYRGKELLAKIGVRVPEGALARNADEAVATAARIGFPVVLKAQSAALSHKSDVGAVALALRDADAVRAAWATMQGKLASLRPAPELDGILVEKMASKGMELIVGARVDPDWGPVLLVGAGGVLAEAIGDTLLLMPDVTPEDALDALMRLKSAKLFGGFRGSPKLDVRAAAEAISLMGAFVRGNPRVRELDINPLLVHPEGQGVTALDALMVIGDNQR